MIALYKHLGVQYRQADFSYSFSMLSGADDEKTREITTSMIYNGASGREGVSMPSTVVPDARKNVSLLSTPLAFTFALLTDLHAYGVFVLSTLVLLLFYLRLVVLSLPIHIPDQLHIPFTLYSISLKWIPIPRRPTNKFLTLLEWTEMTTPRGRIVRFLELDVRWQLFVEDVLVPLFSAVCTASRESVWEHPVEEFLGAQIRPRIRSDHSYLDADYVWLTFGTHHYVVTDGVRDVVRRITRPIPPTNIHLSTRIVALAYNADVPLQQPTVDIQCEDGTIYTDFAHIIVATQADHAANLLDSYLDTLPSRVSTVKKNQSALDTHRSLVASQVENLRRFTYCRTLVVNHTDSTLLPSDRRDWRDLNLVMAPAIDWAMEDEIQVKDPTHLSVPLTYAMATHILSPSEGIYQTTNPIVPPRADHVLSVSRLERAVVTIESKDAVQGFWKERKQRKWKWGTAGRWGSALGPLQGAGRLQEGRSVPGIWLSGSYAGCGIPLLEACVVSGRNVVEKGVWKSEGVSVRSVGRLW